MRKTILATITALAAATTLQAAAEKKEEPAAAKPAAPAPEATAENVSFAIGTMIGKNLKQQAVDVKKDELMAGIDSGLTGGKGRLDDQQVMQIMQAYQQKQMAAQEAKSAAAAGPNKEAGKAYLVTNAKKEGVTTTASGLQYEVMKKSEGAKPTAADTVKVHYHGTLIDGSVFDSSVDRGEPIEFPLNGVIKGWTEGVQLMSVGSKFKFTIPSDLAYGERGTGEKIGPGSTLIFEVELLGITKK